MITDEQMIDMYQTMRTADAGHLALELQEGNREAAHRYVDSIINSSQAIEDIEQKLVQTS